MSDLDEFLGEQAGDSENDSAAAMKALGFAKQNEAEAKFLIELVNVLRVIEEAKISYTFENIINVALNRCNIDCTTGEKLPEI